MQLLQHSMNRLAVRTCIRRHPTTPVSIFCMEEESTQLLEPQEQQTNTTSLNPESGETQIQVSSEDPYEDEVEENGGEELVTIAQYHAPPRPSPSGQSVFSKYNSKIW